MNTIIRDNGRRISRVTGVLNAGSFVVTSVCAYGLLSIPEKIATPQPSAYGLVALAGLLGAVLSPFLAAALHGIFITPRLSERFVAWLASGEPEGWVSANLSTSGKGFVAFAKTTDYWPMSAPSLESWFGSAVARIKTENNEKRMAACQHRWRQDLQIHVCSACGKAEAHDWDQIVGELPHCKVCRLYVD